MQCRDEDLLGPVSLALLVWMAGRAGPPFVDRATDDATTATTTPYRGRGLSNVPEASCPDPDREKLLVDSSAHLDGFVGTGRMLMEPAKPRLVPGQEARFNLTLRNPDCRVFFYTPAPYDCGYAPLVQIGDGPIHWWAWDPPLSLHWWVVHSCPIQSDYDALGPGETFREAFAWDGIVELVTHPAAGSSGVWQRGTHYVGAGKWPVRFGFFGPSSHDVAGTTNITVEENDRNRGSPVKAGGCARLGYPTHFNVTDAAVRVSSRTAKIGTPVTVDLSYRLDLPAPGCYAMEGETFMKASGSAATRVLGTTCESSQRSDRRFTVILDAPTSTFDAYLRFSWDGGGGACGGGAVPAGNYTLQPAGGVFAIQNAAPSATIEWT